MPPPTPAIRIAESCVPCNEVLSVEYHTEVDLRTRATLLHRLNLVKLAFRAYHEKCRETPNVQSPPQTIRNSEVIR
jgi:hypothetical protein